MVSDSAGLSGFLIAGGFSIAGSVLPASFSRLGTTLHIASLAAE